MLSLSPVQAVSFFPHPGGKRDEKLILPINSSLSVTLHQDQVGPRVSRETRFVWGDRLLPADGMWLKEALWPQDNLKTSLRAAILTENIVKAASAIVPCSFL